MVYGDGKRAGPGAGASAASRDHRAVAQRLGMTRVKLGGLPARGAGVEDERGHGCWGVSPVGHGLGRLAPHGGPRAGATSGGLVGSPRRARILFTAGASVMKAMMRIYSPAERAAQGQDLVDASQQQRPEAG